MMKIKRAIALFLSLSVCCSCFVQALAEAESMPELNLTFNNLPTNAEVAEGLVLSGGKIKIQDLNKNKAVYLAETDTRTQISANGISNPEGNTVYSVDVKGDNRPVNLEIGTATSTNGAGVKNLIKIEDNRIFLSNSYQIGSVNKNKFTTISFVIKKEKICDIYINYSLAYANYKFTSTAESKSIIIGQPQGNSCFIDNIRSYIADMPSCKKSEAPYSNEVIDVIGAADYAGDYCFFDNRFCYTSGNPKYNGAYFAKKTNEIITTRLIDYQSPERTDYIYLNRFDTSNDCYFEITVAVGGGTNNPSKQYRFFKMEGDFKIDKLGSVIQFPMLRDSKTTGASINGYPVRINATGGLNCVDNRVIPNVIKQGEWFHCLMFFDIAEHYCDVYVDGDLIVDKVPINNEIKQLNLVRICLESGGPGDLYVDNFDFTGLAKPIVNGVETKTSVFPEGEEVKKFLEDKIALHAYGNTLYRDGIKTELEKGIYEKYEERYYVPLSTLSQAFDLKFDNSDSESSSENVMSISSDGIVTKPNGETVKLSVLPKTEDGKIYVSVKEFAQEVLGKKSWSFKTGMFLFSDKEININTDGWEYQSQRVVKQTTVWNDIDHLNNFLQYLRPDIQRLKADYIETTGDADFTKHPRLLLNEEQFEEHRKHYKARDNEVYNIIVDEIIKQADSYLDKDPVGYEWDDSMRTLGATAGNLLKRFINMGYAYQLTGDEKYVRKAVEQFEMCSTYPDFNTSHIIDSGDDCLALAIGFDWFCNAFTPEEREMARRVVHDTALRTLASGLYGRITSSSTGSNMWYAFKWMSNYNSIINGGVITASIATLEYDTDETFQYIADSLYSMEYSLQMLTPDGGWNEAVTYWNYAMRYIMTAAAALNGCFGTNYGMMDGQGMSNTLNYVISCLGTTAINNYGDTEVGKASTAYSFNTFYGLAKMYNNTVANSMRSYDIQARGRTPDYHDAIFFNFDMQNGGDNVYASMPNLLRTNGTEIISIRDTYDRDKSQSYFSAHFGTTSGYHQHCDCGTFVLDLMGERWAEDLGRDEYNIQNEKGYKDYQIYRKRAEGHNVLLLNPSAYGGDFEMKSGKFSPIIDAKSNDYSGYVYANLDDVYNEASKMKLGYFMDENMSSLTMRNEFTMDIDCDAMWSFHTCGDILIDGDIAYINKGGKSIKLEFITTGANAHWEELPEAPLETSPQCPEQNKNVEYRKVVLKFDVSSGDNYLVVKISPMGTATKRIWDVPIDNWKLTDKFETSNIGSTEHELYYNGEKVSGALPVYQGVMPKINVVTKDPKAIVEMNEAKDVFGKTVIKVWDSQNQYFTLSTVEYYRASNKTLDMFNEIPIESVTVSSEPEPQNKKDNMLDGSLETRWTGMAVGEYAVFDLGAVVPVDGVSIAFWKGAERQYYFDIYVSEDGENWQKAYIKGQSTGTLEDLEAFAFDTTMNARYIKCVGNGNSVQSVSRVNINVLEFRALRNK